MNYNDEYEDEIDLKQLLFYELYKWRPIILTALIAGVLLGGYKVASETVLKRDAEIITETQEVNAAIENYERSVAIYEREIENMQKMVVNQKAYLDHSVLMDINSYEKPEASADVFVKLDDSEWLQGMETANMDPTDGIVNAYVSNIADRIEWKELVDELGVDVVYLKELVSTETDYIGNTIHITVCYSDLKTADMILDKILQQIEQGQRDISASLGKHTTTVLNRTSGIVNDTVLSDLQMEMNDRASNYQKSLIDKEKALKSLEKPNESAQISGKQIAKFAIKYAVLGVVGGACLMMIFFGLQYVLNTSLRTADELKSRFGFRLVGVFSPQVRTGTVERWLERLEGIGERESAETVLDRAALNIQNYGENTKKILIAGEFSEEKLQEWASEFSDRTKGMEFDACSDLIKSPKALRQLSECDGVVLVVQRGVTKVGEIQKEKEIIEGWKKEIVGCLVI